MSQGHPVYVASERYTSRFHRNTIGFSPPGSDKTRIIFDRSMEKPHFFQETCITKLNSKSQKPGPSAPVNFELSGKVSLGGPYAPPGANRVKIDWPSLEESAPFFHILKRFGAFWMKIQICARENSC